MPTLRQRAAKLFLREELGRLEETTDLFLQAYRLGPALMSPERLLSALQEVDSQLIDLIMQQRGLDILYGGAWSSDLTLTEQDRLRVVYESRRMVYHDTQARNAVSTWTDFGFGRSVSVLPNDPAAVPIWEEFWTARRNKPLLSQREIHQLSNRVTQDGELFFTFWTNAYSGLNSRGTTLRLLKTEQINKIVYKEGDDLVPLYYVQRSSVISNDRTYTEVYYPDWAASEEDLAGVELPPGAVLADDLREGTVVVAMQAALNKQNGRGWPQFRQAFRWFRAYSNALEDVLAKNRAIAMFVDKIKTRSGSRAVDAIAARLTSSYVNTDQWLEDNPPPVPGSTWLENEMATRTRFPLGTAAGDDRQSTMIVLGQGSAGTDVPLGWMGRPDSWQNRSVAEMTVLPWMETMSRYQSWWVDVFGDIAEIVLRQSGISFKDYTSTVTLETPVNIDLALLVNLFSNVERAALDMIMPLPQARAIMQRLAAIALERFGVRDAQAILEPEEKEVEQEVEAAIEIAKRNLANGSITVEQVGEFTLGILVDGHEPG